MQKKSEDFSMQDALRLANSDAGQQLLALLKRTDNDALQQAMDQAASGGYSQAAKTLSQAFSSPEIRALMQKLEDEKNG